MDLNRSSTGPDARKYAITGVLLFGVLVLGAFVAARRFRPSEKPVTRQDFPAFVGSGRSIDCSNGCIPLAGYIARAEFGLEPTLSNDIDEDPSTILRALSVQARVEGRLSRCITIPELLSNIKKGPMRPAILVHENGHMALLIGTFKEKEELLYQLVHGDMNVALVSQLQLIRSGFKEAWQVTASQENIPITLGSANLQVDKIFHNLGEVKPDTTPQCSFSLTNCGRVPVILTDPQTSCSCVVMTQGLADKILRSSETVELRFTVHPSNTGSINQTVHMTLVEQGSGISNQLHFSIFGSQTRSLEVTPSSLDFGSVTPGMAYIRNIRLSEVPTDRFALERIDYEGLPLTHQVQQTVDRYGLTTYRIRLCFSPNADNSGMPKSSIVLVTSSRVRRTISVPIRFKIAPSLELVPSVISLGTVDVGETREVVVSVVSKSIDAETLQIKSAPPECAVSIDRQSIPPTLIVRTKLTEPGVWQGIIIARIQDSSGEKLINVKCVGFAK